MARRDVVVITDDVDGSEISVRQVRFSYEGVNYTIDLSIDNQKVLSEALAPFMTAGRRLSPSGAAVTRTAIAPTGKAYNEAVRAWLKGNGYADELTDRGRIANRLLAAYESRLSKVPDSR